MAELINMSRAAWKRQPSGVVRKNPSILEKWNVSEGIVCLPVQQTPVHLMSNTTIELVNTAYTNLVSTEGGYLYVFMEGIGGTGRLLRMQTGSPNTRSFVFMTRFRINADLGGSGLLMRSGTTGETSTLIPLWRSGTAFDMRVGGTDYTAAGTFNVGQFYNLTIIGSETSCQLYVNNDLIINGSVAASATIDSDFCIGDVTGGALASNTLEFQYILFLKKAFPFDTIRALHENPWQLFAPAPSRFYLIPSSGSVTFQSAWARSRSIILGSGV